MAQVCKASRLLLNAPPTAPATVSAKVSASLPAESPCERAENTVAPAWQQSARDGRAKGAHSSRKFFKDNSFARAFASKQPSAALHKSFVPCRVDTPYSNLTTADNSVLPADENAKISVKLCAVTCVNLASSAMSHQNATQTQNCRANATPLVASATGARLPNSHCAVENAGEIFHVKRCRLVRQRRCAILKNCNDGWPAHCRDAR